MNLLTQEQGALLKPGDKVNVYWFQPRPTSKGAQPVRQFDGRDEWIASVDKGRVVDSLPWKSASDGLLVKLVGSPYASFRVDKMERAV